MSGLEPIATVVGPKVATGLATALLTKLLPRVVRSPVSRWRTWRKVSRAAGVRVPRRLFDRWLRDAVKDQMQSPLSQAGAALAGSLDDVLQTNTRWRKLEHRRSLALRLVEETYAAILTFATESEARVLEEKWAASRHAEIVVKLAQATGRESLTASDYGAILLSESASRRMNRLQGFTLSDAQVRDLLDIMPNGAIHVEAGTVLTITGAFGAGKSEQAETWFADAAKAYACHASGRIPVWFAASELAAMNLTMAIRARINEARGALIVAVVVDGLDETDSAAAARIADEARVLVQSNPSSQVLLTARPNVIRAERNDIAATPLDDEHLAQVMQTVAGDSTSVWQWNEPLQDAIRRPFFAIAVAVAKRDGMAVTGQASVIRAVVERALETPTSRKHVLEPEPVYRILTDLAVSRTNNADANDGLSFGQRQRVLSSRLVEIRTSNAEFTLPIFQQWFAAQALLANPALIDAALATAVSFDRWRWALAIACIASDEEQMDGLLARIFQANPGAGMWLIAEVVDSLPSVDETDVDNEAATTKLGERLLSAARVQADSLASISPFAFPLANSGSPIVLGLRASGPNAYVGWSSDTQGEDRLVDLPAREQLFSENSLWHPRLTGSRIANAAWPWQYLRTESADRLKQVLPRAVFGSKKGVWATERRHQIIRALLRAESLLFPPIDRISALKQVAELVERMGSQIDTTVVRLSPKLSVPGPEFLDMKCWLEELETAQIDHHLPTPDVIPSPNGWVWDMYSVDQLARFARDTFALACEAYDEAAMSTFATLGWYRQTGAPEGFGVLAQLSHRDDDAQSWGGPIITHTILPLEMLREEVAKADVPFQFSRNGRAAIAITPDLGERNYIHGRVEELWETYPSGLYADNPMRRLRVTDSFVEHIGAARPASATALSWIWEDLSSFRWVSGDLKLSRLD